MKQVFVPAYFISLSEVEDYTEFKRFCKKHDIRYMLYTIMWREHVLKYGIQHVWDTTTYGDRVYTQIGWMPGWKKDCLQRGKKTGLATQSMIEKIESMYGVTFHKNDVSLIIEDLTEYPFINPANRYPEIQNLEEYAKLDHYNKHGCFPIGNLKQEKIRPIPQLNLGFFDFGD